MARWRRRILVDVDVVVGGGIRSCSEDVTACADLFRARGRIAHGEQRARRRTTDREDEWLLKLQHLRLLRNPSRTGVVFLVAVSNCRDPVEGEQK